jgi:hypothetical protein
VLDAIGDRDGKDDRQRSDAQDEGAAVAFELLTCIQ